MKIRQNVRHWAAKKALTMPVVGEYTNDKLVDIHTGVFLDRAEERRREERRAHLDDFFDATMDTYVAALEAGFPEAEAREITHAQANFDFYNHGWTEMMEFPADEVEAHYDRYEGFFREHGITIDDPLGEFRPAGGIAGAPSTPEKLDDPVHPHAEGGFADDVYVETADGEVVVGGGEEPEEVEVDRAPGVDPEDADGVDEADGAGAD
ncbi:DUF6149 family protein [Salinirussus salinus]|uniref:DUF6149 family protein n=1 Tax=Salinirussus salinus TaxID=1198300 RepID=UPI00135779B1|nr:DUF6149 family protein [Salinirussus salinus]